jgi:SAM-dependent methyltransferase
MKNVFKKLSVIDAGIVLDAATGRGEFINTIRQFFRSYTHIVGIDISDKAVQYAQKLYPENDIEIYRMDLNAMDYEDAHFDTVCIVNSLHHLDDPTIVLSELIRVLKPGGMLLVSEMYRDGKQSEAQKTHIHMHHWIAQIDQRMGIPHRETYTKKEILDFVNSLPCRNMEVDDFYFPVDNPKEAKNCENLLKNCNDTMKRLENMDDSQGLLLEGQKIMARIHEIGCASASRLLITAYKV